MIQAETIAEVETMSEAEIEELVRQTLEGNTEVEGASDREYADVTASCSWAGGGGNMHGWITFAGAKVYFKATRITRRQGFYAGSGGALRNAALKPELLGGKTGTFTIKNEQRGRHRVLVLQMWVAGKPVLQPSVVLWGVGGGDLLEGEVSFTVHN